ncbi:MAG TPA: hypothetical protein VJQ45_00830 [Ktedonobacterales bacterium]|nr:hypothetical protein [Ktedonobacterales bacterium]
MDLFAAVSAFAGAIGLVVGYMNIPLDVLRTTPFADFTVPALLLGIVVGGSALTAAVIAVFGPRSIALLEPWRFDALATAAAGCIMVGWMTIEIAMIGLGSWLQPAYFVVGLVMIGLAGLLQWAEAQQTSVRARHHAHAA